MKELELLGIESLDKLVDYEKNIDLLNRIGDFTYFDYVLTSEWLKAMKNEVFKFKLESPLPTRCLNGKFSFLVQLNPKRYTEKRPSEIKQSLQLNQKFDKSRFNFTQINEKEILFKVNIEQGTLRFSHKQIRPTHESSDQSSYIIINNSPIEYGHSLIVPHLNLCQNQVLNDEAIELAVRISMLSGSTHFIVGFNSINAHASVNHLHMHIYYINFKCYEKKYPFPIQNVMQAEQIAKNLWFINENSYYLPAFLLQLCDFNNDFREFSRNIYLVTDYMIKNNISHNMVLVKADSFKSGSLKKPDNTNTLKAVIWPRKPTNEIPQNSQSINFAMCELSGHFFILDQEHFDHMNEIDILNLATNVKLEQTRLQYIKAEIQSFFANNC